MIYCLRAMLSCLFRDRSLTWLSYASWGVVIYVKSRKDKESINQGKRDTKSESKCVLTTSIKSIIRSFSGMARFDALLSELPNAPRKHLHCKRHARLPCETRNPCPATKNEYRSPPEGLLPDRHTIRHYDVARHQILRAADMCTRWA